MKDNPVEWDYQQKWDGFHKSLGTDLVLMYSPFKDCPAYEDYEAVYVGPKGIAWDYENSGMWSFRPYGVKLATKIDLSEAEAALLCVRG